MKWVFMSLISLNLLIMVIFWRDMNSIADYQTKTSMTLLGDSIELLSESDLSPGGAKEKPLTNVARGELVQCYVVGPFNDRDDARFMGVRADALGYQSTLRNMVTGVESDSWVYIPPLSNRQQSLQLLNELKGRGFDGYILTQGEMSEGISLGLFNNEQAAENLNNKVRQLGYGSMIKRVDRGVKAIWLEFAQVEKLTQTVRARITGTEKQLNWKLTGCSNS